MSPSHKRSGCSAWLPPVVSFFFWLRVDPSCVFQNWTQSLTGLIRSWITCSAAHVLLCFSLLPATAGREPRLTLLTCVVTTASCSVELSQQWIRSARAEGSLLSVVFFRLIGQMDDDAVFSRWHSLARSRDKNDDPPCQTRQIVDFVMEIKIDNIYVLENVVSNLTLTRTKKVVKLFYWQIDWTQEKAKMKHQIWWVSWPLFASSVPFLSHIWTRPLRVSCFHVAQSFLFLRPWSSRTARCSLHHGDLLVLKISSTFLPETQEAFSVITPKHQSFTTFTFAFKRKTIGLPLMSRSLSKDVLLSSGLVAPKSTVMELLCSSKHQLQISYFFYVSKCTAILTAIIPWNLFTQVIQNKNGIKQRPQSARNDQSFTWWIEKSEADVI